RARPWSSRDRHAREDQGASRPSSDARPSDYRPDRPGLRERPPDPPRALPGDPEGPPPGRRWPGPVAPRQARGPGRRHRRRAERPAALEGRADEVGPANPPRGRRLARPSSANPALTAGRLRHPHTDRLPLAARGRHRPDDAEGEKGERRDAERLLYERH